VIAILIPKIVQFPGYAPFSKNQEPTFIEELKEHRPMHGLSQKRLAKVLRIDPATLARWEKGRSKPGRC
jgi:DNA-binding transcriptional regulator YiaG